MRKKEGREGREGRGKRRGRGERRGINYKPLTKMYCPRLSRWRLLKENEGRIKGKREARKEEGEERGERGERRGGEGNKLDVMTCHHFNQRLFVCIFSSSELNVNLVFLDILRRG